MVFIYVHYGEVWECLQKDLCITSSDSHTENYLLSDLDFQLLLTFHGFFNAWSLILGMGGSKYFCYQAQPLTKRIKEKYISLPLLKYFFKKLPYSESSSIEYFKFQTNQHIGLSTEGLDKKHALNIYPLGDLPSSAFTETRNQRKMREGIC